MEAFRMLKLNESQAEEFIADLAAKCDRRWKETVDKTRFMDELREGKLKELGLLCAGDQFGLHLGLL
jgi:hypothetical protein